MKSPTIVLLILAAPLAAATYYVDSVQGNDSNPGTSLRAPWKSLEKVNSQSFRPGDRIQFKRGSEWKGQLAPKSSGAQGAPIVFESYGKGSWPRINGAGEVEDAIRLYNVERVEIRNLEVTNSGTSPAVRRGVHIFADNFGVVHDIVISGLYIHDVNGTNERKDNGGIVFRSHGGKVATRFDGLTIQRNIVWKVDRSAIVAQSSHWSRSAWNPSLRVVIRDNFVDDIGGDGIVPWATESALIEHNIARNCNRRAGSYNAGIWPWSTDNSLFQLNEAYLTRTTLDGQGFDSDFNSRNTVFQYNYSHDNEGGFMLICTPGKRNLKENLGNLGTIVRHNISRNDRARIFHISAAEHTLVYDNAIYVGPDLDVQMVITTDWDGWASDAIFRANRFYVEGTARYGHQAGRNKDGTYTMDSGWGPASGIVFDGNKYAGRQVDQPADKTGVQVTLADAPKIDWTAPEFDPASPAKFDEFLVRHREWMIRLFERQFGTPPNLHRP
ncbi:MAG: right-handed parallel beta-helix repeat-containing protein [Bryobacteraceae bacterium]